LIKQLKKLTFTKEASFIKKKSKFYSKKSSLCFSPHKIISENLAILLIS
jgi:hypothetical protein